MKQFFRLLTVMSVFISCTRENISRINQSNSDVSNLTTGSNTVWEAFLGTDPKVRALPDFYSNYFAYSFDRTQDTTKYIGLRLKGKFGYARYMSFNLYDAKEGTSFGSITDTALIPDKGSVNPFKTNADFYASKRDYTLVVVPNGYDAGNAKNVFRYDPNLINYLCVMIRYYVPQVDSSANEPLPTIEAFNLLTGETVNLPTLYSLKDAVPKFIYTKRLLPIWTTIVDDSLRFYHASGGGQFNNADNIYLISALVRKPGQVFVLRFKPPTFRHDRTTEGNTDVRYWSINEGKYNTTTPYGMKDSGFRVASDGFVYVVIGDRSPGFEAQAKKGGYNFMKWSLIDPMMVLLYRNMLGNPAYPGYLGKVPVLDTSVTDYVHVQNACRFIGDYAPQGQRITRAAFMQNYGGWPAPGF